MKKYSLMLIGIMIFVFLGIPTQKANSHCDTKSGPVISAAKEALKTGNINLVMIWVKPEAEAEIKNAFEKTLEIRKLNPKAQDFADNYFFETLVRIHRQGEGAPYTGIKEDGEIEPPIKASDKALETESDVEIIKMLSHHIHKGVSEKFKEMIEHKNFEKNNVNAGREFVSKYVTFMHYVEGIYNAINISHGHGENPHEENPNNHID